DAVANDPRVDELRNKMVVVENKQYSLKLSRKSLRIQKRVERIPFCGIFCSVYCMIILKVKRRDTHAYTRTNRKLISKFFNKGM
ncbi:hypothetical protein PDJ90_18300, partial [Bacillus cereus]|nr:hypothetical protein [Bacillus cereus]